MRATRSRSVGTWWRKPKQTHRSRPPQSIERSSEPPRRASTTSRLWYRTHSLACRDADSVSSSQLSTAT